MAHENRFGLSRYIPEPVKKDIRRNAGYGCVICGNAIIDYEHVDPDFIDCRQHEADKITLLCPSHHRKKTIGTLSTDAVKAAMLEPWAFRHGLSHDDLELPPGPSEIHIGSSVYTGMEAILTVNDEPIVWFAAPESRNGPARLNCTFCSDNGELIARIDNNQYRSMRTSCDVTMIGSTIAVKDADTNKRMLVIERIGGEAVRILEMNMFYGGWTFEIHDGSLIASCGTSRMEISNSTFQGQGGSVFSLHAQGFQYDPDLLEFKEWCDANSECKVISTGGYWNSLDGQVYLTKRRSPVRAVKVDSSTRLEERYLSTDGAEVTIFLCKNREFGLEFYRTLNEDCSNVRVNHGDPVSFIVVSIEGGFSAIGSVLCNQPHPSQYREA